MRARMISTSVGCGMARAIISAITGGMRRSFSGLTNQPSMRVVILCGSQPGGPLEIRVLLDLDRIDRDRARAAWAARHLGEVRLRDHVALVGTDEMHAAVLFGGVDVHGIRRVGAIVAITRTTELTATQVCCRNGKAKAHRLLRGSNRHDGVVVLTGKTLAALVVEVARRADHDTVIAGGGSTATTGTGTSLAGGIGAVPFAIAFMVPRNSANVNALATSTCANPLLTKAAICVASK